jgi:hypothetical protein
MRIQYVENTWNGTGKTETRCLKHEIYWFSKDIWQSMIPYIDMMLNTVDWLRYTLVPAHGLVLFRSSGTSLINGYLITGHDYIQNVQGFNQTVNNVI